jgi:hypothetical protein
VTTHKSTFLFQEMPEIVECVFIDKTAIYATLLCAYKKKTHFAIGGKENEKQKTPPLSDQTGVTFFHQKQKGKPFDVSELFSVPFWRMPENVVLEYGRTLRRFLLAAEQCWKYPMLSYPVRLLRRIRFPSLH